MFQKKKVLNLTFIKGYSAGVFSDSDLLDKQCTELSDVLLVIMTTSRIHVFSSLKMSLDDIVLLF